MSSIPPPAYIPRSPHRQPGISPASIVVLVILAVFVFVLFCGGMAFLGSKLMRSHLRAHGHDPVTGTPLGNGWASYHIPALELTIASNPRPVAITEWSNRIRTRTDISEYAGYRMKSPSLHAEIFGYWMRNSGATLKEMADSEENAWTSRHTEFTTTKQKETMIGGVPARIVTVEFPWDGRNWVANEAVFIRGKVQYYFEGVYWRAPNRWAEDAYEDMVRSIRFDPSGPSGKWEVASG